MIDKYRFTRRQEHAIGQLVTDNWHCHFQTGFQGDLLVLYAQASKHSKKSWLIHRDGTVVENGA